MLAICSSPLIPVSLLVLNQLPGVAQEVGLKSGLFKYGSPLLHMSC